MVRFTLDNGLRGVVDPSGQADVVAIHVWLDVGSADEPPGLEGAAHVVEHMVFKGTRRFAMGEVAAEVESVGGELNAWTAFDETVFHVTVPSAGVERAMEVLAEMVRHATFDADELHQERRVILEEIRSTKDDPDSILGEASWGAVWGDHPYGRPIIGYARSVARMTRDDLLRFYRSRYQPSNAVLAVAGPVDPAHVEAQAVRLFGGGRRAAPSPRRPATARRARPRVLQRGFEAALVDLSWPVPGVGHPDLPALDTLAMALGGGSSSPLEARLRLVDRLALSAEAHLDVERDGGVFGVELQPREGRVREVVAVAREIVAAAREEPVEGRILERAKAQLLAQRVFGREVVDGRAHSLAWNLAREGDPEAWRAYDAAVAAVSRDDLLRVARRWLAPADEVAVALLPEDEPRSIGRRSTRSVRSGAVEAKREEAPAKLSPRRPPGPQAPRRVVLDNGLRVLLLPDGGETSAVRVAGLGGAFLEDTHRAGRTAAWARAVVRGSGDLDALGFASAVESIAGSATAAPGRSSMLVRGEFLADRLHEGLELVAGVVRAPRFDEQEVAAARAELEEAIGERADHPSHLLQEEVWASAYGDHPYGLPPLGTSATLAGHDVAALRAHHAAWATAANLVVTVAGGFDADAMLGAVERAFGGLPRGAAPRLSAPPRLAGAAIRSVRGGKEQAHLSWVWPGAAVGGPEEGPLELLSIVLGGQGGRLFVELREREGLAYAVGCASQEGLHQGLLVCSLATEPARVEEAEARLAESIARVADGSIRAEEVERARAYALGATEADIQTAGARANLAAYTELYGRDGLRYRSDVRSRLLGVSVEEVRAAASVLARPPLVRGRLLPAGD